MPSSWPGLLAESPRVIALAGIILAGLWASNFAYDRDVPQYVSRKIGHAAGGLCFLLAPFLFSSVWLPVFLAGAFAVILLLARLLRPDTFRGVGGNRRGSDSFAEIAFAAVAVPVYLVGWWWLKQPLAAAAALLFMAWGDGVTGLVRARLYRRPVKGLWGSAAMLGVCLALAWALVKPFWAGGVAALAATGTEMMFGDVGLVKRIDDNLAIPIISLGVVAGLLALV